MKGEVYMHGWARKTTKQCDKHKKGIHKQNN